ncbi:hypothetical protein Plhal703r1_c07g0039871 [Plasmopara halstedii]
MISTLCASTKAFNTFNTEVAFLSGISCAYSIRELMLIAVSIVRFLQNAKSICHEFGL